MAAELAAHEGSDEELVDALFRLVLRREPEPEARERALAQLADGTLSRATLVHELADERGIPARARARRRRGARARAPARAASGCAGSRLRPARTSASSRSRGCSRAFAATGRVLEVGYAFAEPAYLGGLLRAGVELVGVGPRDPRRRRHRDRRGGRPLAPVPGSLVRPGPPRLDARARRRRQHACTASPPSATAVRRDSRRSGSSGASSGAEEACSSRCRSASPATTAGSVRRTSRAGRRSSPKQGFFVEELEPYELSADGWRAAPSFDAGRGSLRRARAGRVGGALRRPLARSGCAAC